jgi:hypothetical protein
MPFSIVEDRYVVPTIETVRVVNVNIDNWSVDVISEFASKRYFDIQVMSPYFHYANGEGIYVVPEVGALAWLCRPSAGRFGAPFIMGFQAPFDTANANFSSGRQALNAGDIMMRTRDENFIILRRGGVIQIGATPTCQTLYVPIRNMIRHFCENFELNTFGGELLWSVDRTDKTTDGSAPTTLYLNVKERANDPAHVAKISLGSQGEGDATILTLSIFDSGKKDAAKVIGLTMTKDGQVAWDIRKSLDVVVKESISFATEEKDISFDSGKDFVALAKANMNLEAQGNITQTAAGHLDIAGQNGTVIGGATVKVGGAGANFQMVRGPELTKYLDLLVGWVTTISAAVAVPSDAPTLVLDTQKSLLLSPNTFTD